VVTRAEPSCWARAARLLLAPVVALLSFGASGQQLTQNFDDISTLAAAGWVFTNNSSLVGPSGWFQGNGAIFAAQTGASGSYIAANFVNAGVGGNVSNWLLSPLLSSLQNGETLTFYTRSAGSLADRLEVRVCTGPTCTDVGATDSSVGGFTTLLLSINPGQAGGIYPTSWTQSSVVLSGLPGGTNTGRIAFRYFISGTASSGDYIGIDTLNLTGVTAAPPVFQSAASRRTHGAAGTFDLPLSTVAPPGINHNPTTEPRQGPAQTIVFTFDKPLNAATVSVTEGTATASAPTFGGNSVLVGLTGVTNQQYVTVALTNVASTDGGTGGSASVRIGFLAGDVNQTRVVSVADLGIVNGVLAQVVNASNFLKDVNASGTLTVADKGITNANLTKALATP
jgi:hypothetical protein